MSCLLSRDCVTGWEGVHERFVSSFYFDYDKGSPVECDDVGFELAGQPVLLEHKAFPAPDVECCDTFTPVASLTISHASKEFCL